MDIRRGLVVLAVVVAICSMLASVAVAHHARSAYSEEDVILEGVVVEFTWRNPHVQLAFDVTDASGKTETWRGELSAVTSMIAAGLNRTTFRPGDPVKVEARTANSGEPFAVLGSLWKGDTLVLDGDYRELTR